MTYITAFGRRPATRLRRSAYAVAADATGVAAGFHPDPCVVADDHRPVIGFAADLAVAGLVAGSASFGTPGSERPPVGSISAFPFGPFAAGFLGLEKKTP